MFQSHIERFSPCRGGPQVCCARPDRERQRPGLRLTPGVAYRWNPDLSMRRRFKRMMGRARGRRIGVRHFLPRMKWTTTTTTRTRILARSMNRIIWRQSLEAPSSKAEKLSEAFVLLNLICACQNCTFSERCVGESVSMMRGL